MAELTTGIIMSALEGVYAKAIDHNVPGIESSISLGNYYLKDNNNNREDAIDYLINWQCSKSALTGAVSNVGGVITLPVAIPAELLTTFYIDMRMIAAIAHICGYNVNSDQVKTMCFLSMCGDGVKDIAKEIGVGVGIRLTRQLIESISGRTIVAINKAVGFRLLTKFGSKGLVNLGKCIPFVASIIAGGFDLIYTYSNGKAAKAIFYNGKIPD